MKDFRDKIKTHKPVPNEQAWENFEILLNKDTKKKRSGLWGLLLLLNTCLFVSSLWFFNASNQQNDFHNIASRKSDQKNITNEKSVFSNTDAEKIKSDLTNEKAELLTNQVRILEDSINNLIRINAILNTRLTNSNGNFQTLNNTLSNLTSKFNSLKNSRQEDQSIIVVGDAPDASQSRSIEKLNQENSFDVLMSSLPYMPSSSKMMTLKNDRDFLIMNNDISQISDLSRWSSSVGFGRAKDIYNRVGIHLTSMLHYALHKKFSMGLGFAYSKSKIHAEYDVFNDIKDNETELSAHFLLRYQILKINNIDWFVEGGIGYSANSLSWRQNYFRNGELRYFNDLNKRTDLSYMISSGIYYNLYNNISLGIIYSAYKSEYESLGIGVRLRMK